MPYKNRIKTIEESIRLLDNQINCTEIMKMETDKPTGVV